MIEVQNLTKRYEQKTAVDDVSFAIQPGSVTGFLGPNGAGKSTTMRMILGLDRPTSGRALVNGRSYASAPAPLAELGALLDAKAVDKTRSARNHLIALGATVGIGPARVDEVLDIVGLSEVSHKAAGSFSLGMGQRLGMASALLADPQVVMLDEPVNGLDLDGIQWIRGLLRDLAAEGRTVLLSSHLMSEMQLVAEHLVIIGKGRLLADVAMHEFVEDAAHGAVRIISPRLLPLTAMLEGAGATVSSHDAESAEVFGLTAPEIGDIAASAQLPLHELTPVVASLETAYLELTRDSVEYAGATPSDRPATEAPVANSQTREAV